MKARAKATNAALNNRDVKKLSMQGNKDGRTNLPQVNMPMLGIDYKLLFQEEDGNSREDIDTDKVAPTPHAALFDVRHAPKFKRVHVRVCIAGP